MWLDEIMLTSDRGFARQDVERIARVLREYLSIIKRAEYCDTDGFDLVCPFCQTPKGHLHREDCEYALLSDDAKELLG